MKARFFIILSACFLILGVPVVGAQWPVQRGMGMGHGHQPRGLPEDLRLTTEQMDRLKSIEDSYLNEIVPLRNDLLNKRYELRRLFLDPTSKAYDIRARQEEAFVLETQIQEKIIDYQLKVREVLTPEQFKAWISRYRMGAGAMMGHHHGMRMMH